MFRHRTPSRIATGAAAVLATISLSACGLSGESADAATATTGTATTTDAADTTASTTTATTTTTDSGDDSDAASNDVEEATEEWDAAEEVMITLADGATTVDGDGVTVDGDVVTITAEGTYRISGTLTDGQVVVDAGDANVRLVLDGADITSSSSAAILVEQANDTIVWLTDGSGNHLAGGTETVSDASTEDAANATLFSRDDLSIAGPGTLTVDGTVADGIASKDDLVIVGGTIQVTAIDDGIRGKNSVKITDGIITVDVGGDGITSDDDGGTDDVGLVTITGGTLAITADTDGIDATNTASIDGGMITIDAGDDAIHADARLSVSAGSIDITRSYEGLESMIIEISGGDISIVSSDDGLNVAGGNDDSGRGGTGGGDTFAASSDVYAAISGGTLVIDAGGDGLDSNGSLLVTGGTIVVNGPTEQMNGALDVNGTFTVTDAVLLAAGSAGMAEAPDDGEQATLALQFQSTISAGTVIQIATEDGEVVAVFESSKDFQSLVYTSPDLAAGTTYVVSAGGTVDGTTLGGLLVDGSATGFEEVGTVTA